MNAVPAHQTLEARAARTRQWEQMKAETMSEEIRAAKEAAWDEGHNHCFHVEDPNNAERNPYRRES